jgi:HlyD family secretion protein
VGKTAKASKKEEKPAENGAGVEAPVKNLDEIDEVVFVVQKDKTVKRVKVKTSIQDINNIEVIEGLKAGDEVVVGPYSIVSKTLREGMKVTVVPKDQLFEVKK